MKKLLLTATLSGALLLSACGNTSVDSNKEDDDKSEQQETKKDNNQQAKKDNNNQQETNQNEQENNQKKSDNQEQSNNKHQTNNNEPLSKEEITRMMKNGGNVDGMVDEDGDTWYQAPGTGHDVVGYTKPDGTTCTVGGCTTPEEQEKANKDNKSGGGVTITRDNVIDYVEIYEGHDLNTDKYKFNEPKEKEDGTWGFAFYDKETENLAGSYVIDEDGVVTKYDEDGDITD